MRESLSAEGNELAEEKQANLDSSAAEQRAWLEEFAAAARRPLAVLWKVKT